MSRVYDQHVIIKTLDNPPRMLFWDLDEFLVMITPFFVGMILSSILVMVSGFFLKIAYSSLKKEGQKGPIRHRAYWLIPQGVNRSCGVLKKIPGSHIRRVVL